jgi:hypothetical protein
MARDWGLERAREQPVRFGEDVRARKAIVANGNAETGSPTMKAKTIFSRILV